MEFEQPLHPYWTRALQHLGTVSNVNLAFGRKFLNRMNALFDAMRSQGAVWQFVPLYDALKKVGWDDLSAEAIADHAERVMLGIEKIQIAPAGSATWGEISTALNDEVSQGTLVAWAPKEIAPNFEPGARRKNSDSFVPLLDELGKLGADIVVKNSADDAAITQAQATLGFDFPEWLRDFYRRQGTTEWSWSVDLPEAEHGVYIPDSDHQYVFGLHDALTRSEDYRKTFAEFEDADLPKRFIVVSEAADDNSAWGYVFDAERNAIVRVEGGKGIVNVHDGTTSFSILHQLLSRSCEQLKRARDAQPR